MQWNTHTFTFILLVLVGLWELARGYNVQTAKPDNKLTIRSYYLTGAFILAIALYYAVKLWG